MKIESSSRRGNGFMLMEVVLALFIFAIVATSFTRALSSLWRTTTFVKEELVITQIMDSALHEALYLQQLEEGTTEVYIEERDVNVETLVVPLELENEEGTLLQQMWQVTVIARYEQDGIDEERSARGWRYLPLYRP